MCAPFGRPDARPSVVTMAEVITSLQILSSSKLPIFAIPYMGVGQLWYLFRVDLKCDLPYEVHAMFNHGR